MSRASPRPTAGSRVGSSSPMSRSMPPMDPPPAPPDNSRQGMAGPPRMRSTGAMAPVTAPATAGDTLRAWRERRRLSQLELAIRAGTTQRHVSFVEQGRSRPGRALLLRLAESLELSPRARNQLLLSAGLAPVFPDTPYDDASLAALRAAVDQVLTGHLPFPALV